MIYVHLASHSWMCAAICLVSQCQPWTSEMILQLVTVRGNIISNEGSSVLSFQISNLHGKYVRIRRETPSTLQALIGQLCYCHFLQHALYILCMAYSLHVLNRCLGLTIGTHHPFFNIAMSGDVSFYLLGAIDISIFC